MALERGVALVAPNDQHMEVRNERIVLTTAPPLNSCRPAVDALFLSLARSGVAAQVAAVLLTGMGRDGAEGMAALKQHGAATIAQDEASCTVFGMPKAAIDLGAVEQTLAVADIPKAVTRLFRA
jgi:two-component system chemotaxis response regulator CheB